MADKELRRLKRRELLQMLVMECEEAERLEQESVKVGPSQFINLPRPPAASSTSGPG